MRTSPAKNKAKGKRLPKPKPARKKVKKQYRIRNWHEYDEALKQRGALDVYIETTVLEHWYAAPAGKPGAQPIYSDLAIRLTLEIGTVFGQRLRQTEGLVASVFRLLQVDLDVPGYS